MEQPESQQNDIESLTDNKALTKKQIVKSFAFAFVWCVILYNPSKFFVGLGIAPIDTLASLLGLVAMPLLVSYVLSLALAKFTKFSMFNCLNACLIVMLTLMSIGTIRSSLGV